MSARSAHPLRDGALAFSTLTVLPLRVTWPEGERTDAPGYYPIVGAALGALAFVVVRAATAAGIADRAPLVLGSLVVALWAVATRMLHWDGVGDVADAFGAFGKERRLEIMADSSIGAFGVTAIALFVFVQCASISHLTVGTRAWWLISIPAFARFAATCGAWFGAPARSSGLGASVIGRPRAGALVPAVLTLAAVTALNVVAFGTIGWVVSALGVVLALVVPHVISLRFGGVTGDVMGASVVVVETALLVVIAFAR